MNAIPNQRLSQLSLTSEFDRNDRNIANRLPVQDEFVTEQIVDLRIRIEDTAKETAIGTAKVMIQAPQQSQAYDRSARACRLATSGRQRSMPKESRFYCRLLAGDLINRKIPNLQPAFGTFAGMQCDSVSMIDEPIDGLLAMQAQVIDDLNKSRIVD
jgi:hypothetical protein